MHIERPISQNITAFINKLRRYTDFCNFYFWEINMFFLVFIFFPVQFCFNGKSGLRTAARYVGYKYFIPG